MSILDQFKLDGQTALVTGCKRGIGKAMAIALAEAGADIVGVSATLETEGSDVEQAVTDRGRKFKGYACDFSDRPALYRFITQVKSDFPQIDILVNNAGTIIRVPAVEHPDEDWDKVIEVNLSAQFILSREIGKEMVTRGRGKIIFTASLLTFQGGILVPGYAASKAGLAQVTKTMANDWAQYNIQVNAIGPGWVKTELTQALREDSQRNQEISGRIPMGRWADPLDLAGAAVFLASDASDYITGQTIFVDGGWLSA